MKAYPKAPVKIMCYACRDLIAFRQDLKVMHKRFSCLPMHAKCYEGFFKKRPVPHPVNSFYFTIGAIWAAMVGVFLAVIVFLTISKQLSEVLPEGAVMAILFFVLMMLLLFSLVKVRIESFRKFECPLPKR